MRKVKMVSNWKQSWKWFSVQAFALLAAAPAAWLMMPEDWRSAVPDEWKAVACMIVAGIGIVGRVVSQAKPSEGADV